MLISNFNNIAETYLFVEMIKYKLIRPKKSNAQTNRLLS